MDAALERRRIAVDSMELVDLHTEFLELERDIVVCGGVFISGAGEENDVTACLPLEMAALLPSPLQYYALPLTWMLNVKGRVQRKRIRIWASSSPNGCCKKGQVPFTY